MIGGAHNELGARSDLTELPDDQMVAKLGIVEQHIVFLKVFWINTIIIVSIISYYDVWSFDNVLDKTRSFVFVRKSTLGSGILLISCQPNYGTAPTA